MASPRNILILGASYGSLLATKLLLAGQKVSLVCHSHEADLINSEGTRVRIPLRGREGSVELHSKTLPGRLDACTPDGADPSQYDLIGLAMQEPQYRCADVRELLGRIADSAKPVMSIMNMPPLPFLARIPDLELNDLRSCYGDARVWDGFDPDLFTLASSDPQAFRPSGSPPNILRVTLATNFKVPRFEDAAATAVLAELGSAIEAARFDLGDGIPSELPVKLRLHNSFFVPLAKWSMLLTGNYRCVEADGIRSIRDAVHADLAASRDIYNWVGDVCRAIGAKDTDLVSFEDYANAALSLAEPSSAARALASGATDIERVDLLVQRVGTSKGMRHPNVDATVEMVDSWLLR